MKKILLILLFAVFYTSVNAQCSITATTNASALTCGTAPLSSCGGILYIGNGTNVMSLNMNQNLDLECLGAIQLIVRNNGTLDFSGGNYDLKLASGSSVILQSGSNIYSGSGCSASDRIYIGGSVVANCNGSGSIPSFADVIANGGINQAGILSGNQYICTYGTTTTTFSSTAGSGGVWSSGNTSIATVNSSSGVVTAAGAGTTIITYTKSGVTATRNVYVASGPSANAVISGSTTQCQSSTTSYTATAVSGASSYTWSFGGSGATITPAANGLSASISFSSTATSGNLKVTSTNGCGSAGGGNELWITINPTITAAPVATSISGNVQCDYAEPRWNTVSNATGYYLDIATDSGFTNFVTGYNNYFVSGNNGSSPASNLPAGVLYYRVRAYNSCTTTANSNTVSFQTTAPVGGSVSPAQTICTGNSPTSNLTLSGYTTTNTAIVKWQKASDIGFTSNVSDISETTNVLSIAKIGVLTTSTYFRAVVQNQFGSWCMSNSSPVLITVNNSISVASSTPTVCINTTITPITHTVVGFTGVGTPTGLPAGVTPSLSGNTLTISGTPTASGTFNYIIPLTGGSCGSGTGNATGTITVRPVFTSGTINNTGETICSNTIPTATIGSTTAASGGDNSITYQWQYSTDNTFATGVTTINSNAATYKPTQTLTQTTYYRRQAKDNTCNTTFTSSANIWTVTVTANTLSVAPTGITGTTTICNGASTTLTVSGGTAGTGATVQWFTGSCGGTSAGTGNSITVSPTSNTTYYVRYSGTCNTTTCASQLVTVNTPSVAPTGITGTTTICNGASTTLTVSGGTAGTGAIVEWFTGSCGGTSAGTGNSITVSPTSNTTYYVRYNGTCNTTTCASQLVTVRTLSVAPTGITGTTTICNGASTTLTVSGGTAGTGAVVEWFTGSCGGTSAGTGNSITVSPTSNTTYYVRYSGTCNTTTCASQLVTVRTLSVAPTGITGTTTICNGASTTLTVSGGTAGTGAVVEWFTGSCGGTSAGTGNSITVSPTSNTTYYVRYSGTCNTTTCASQLVTVNPLPGTPTVTAATDVTCSSFLANWTAATNATGYYLDVSTVNNFSSIVAPYNNLDIGLVSSYNVTGLDKKTTYFYRLRAYNSCSTSVNSNYVQIKTLDVPTITAPAASSVCSGNTYSSGAITSTGTIFDWSRAAVANINGGAAGVGGTGIANATGFTEILTNSTANPINVTYVLTPRVPSSGCTGDPYNLVVTVNPTPTAPTIGTITNISCTTSTGSVALSSLPSGNWTITTTPATVSTPGSGSSTTIAGLAAGNYTFTVTNASGCPSTATGTVTISDNSSTTWNGSGWSNGLPDAGKNVIIASVPAYTFAAGFTACALTINSGVVATVPSGVTLTVTNAVTTNGQLIFENTASLVQINNVGNSGAITYKRISQPMKNFDYTYWSSPVAGQTFVALSPNTLSDKYMSFTGTAWKSESPSSIMDKGIGYIIRVPKPNSTYPNGQDYWTGSTYAQPVEFKGVPNNGDITSSQAMTAGNFYLIGNPYPSAMDADEFLFTNLHNRDILGGTIYFWTHNTAITPTGTIYKYSSNDYASYNLTGGAGTSASSPGNNTIPDGYIAAGQSFFATAEAAGNVVFNNSMRVGDNNSKFFKPSKTSKSTRLEKHRLWLNMINSEGAYKQALIGYIEGATNSFDKSFDGLSFDGNSYIDFYSVNAADNYVIQGRALPFTDTDVVPLGYRSTVAGDFTIAIDHADGNLATQRVYLEDKQTGAINELTAGNYTFNTKAGTFNNRFVLRYTNKTLGTGEFETVEDAISILVQNKTVTIDSSVENIDKVFIYDITGKQLYTKDNVNNLQLIMQNLPFAQQVLLVKIFLENGTVTTKKVIFK